MRIHIFGASGSGTTTLGDALGKKLEIAHLDADDYYWKKTDPPFTEKISPEDRVENIFADIEEIDNWILTGSLCSWGDRFMDKFTLVVFLFLDPIVRMKRVTDREIQCYGDRIKYDGDMYENHRKFMSWARSYDVAKAPLRSLNLHESWINRLNCPVIRLDSSQSVDHLISEVEFAITRSFSTTCAGPKFR
jgi:adenylate kinase family enzyme